MGVVMGTHCSGGHDICKWEAEVLSSYETGTPSCKDLMKKYGRKGITAVILKLHPSDGKKMKENDRLCACSLAMQMISSLALRNESIQMVKRDEERAFFFCRTSESALALSIFSAECCAKLSSSSSQIHIDVSVGIAKGNDGGSAIVFSNDMFGDCLNVASKLGEDIASSGDILMDESSWRELREKSSTEDALKLANVKVTSFEMTISGVNLRARKLLFDAESRSGLLKTHFKRDVPCPREFAEDKVYQISKPASPFESVMIKRYLESFLPDSEKIVALTDQSWRKAACTTGTLFNSDMSGFTRLTKKHGILHFLGMILKMRSIVRPIIRKARGQILHFDGDNVIAFFDSSTSACEAALRVQSAVREYNRAKLDDDRILLKIGLSKGNVVNTGLQLYGDAWECCEALGEELGKKRQILMPKAMRDEVDLTSHGSVIKSESTRSHGDLECAVLEILHEDLECGDEAECTSSSSSSSSKADCKDGD
eukprot:g665.t1